MFLFISLFFLYLLAGFVITESGSIILYTECKKKKNIRLSIDYKSENFKKFTSSFVFFSTNSLKSVNILSWRNWETGLNYLQKLQSKLEKQFTIKVR